MEDLHRRTIKLLKRHAPGLQAALVREDRHVIIDFALGEAKVRITMAKTPSCADHEIRNTCTLVCKGLGLPKIRH